MNLPNRLTLARMVAVPAVMALMLCKADYAAAAVFVLACITDFLDGYFARKYNLVSSFGKIMDPLADKLLTFGALLCLTVGGFASIWATMIIISREFFVTCMRVVAGAKGKVIAASMWGKIKTNVQMFALIFAITFCRKYEAAAYALIWLAALFTVASWVAYIYENAEVFKD